MPLKLILKSHQVISHKNHTSSLAAISYGPENFSASDLIIISLTDQQLALSGDRGSAKRQKQSAAQLLRVHFKHS